jgi:hypothetical protein
MANCNICDNDYELCSCPSQEAFCDQCSENNTCAEIIDSDCVIYHPAPDVRPSKLQNLGMPNNSSASAIFEAIDDLIGSGGGAPITGVDSETVDITPGGTALNRTIRADVIVSPDALNQLEVRANGLYGKPYNENYLVKVDAADAPDYLENQIIGDTDGVIFIDAVKETGQIKIKPSIDLAALASSFCASSGPKGILAQCIISSGLSTEDTESVDLTLTNGLLSADVKISATAGNWLSINPDGLYASAATSVTASNGLTKTADNIALGGALTENTQITGTNFNLFLNNNALLLGNQNVVGFAQPGTYAAGENIRLQVFNKSNIRGGSASTTRLFAAHILDNDALVDVGTHQFIGQLVNTYFHYADSATFGASTQDASLGCFLSVSSVNSSAIVAPNAIAAVLGGVYFDSPTAFGETAGTPGTIDNIAIFKTQVPSYQPGMHAGNTPTVTNLYGMYLSDLASGSAAGKFTNKFGVYQLGTTDVNRFFGPVQNAGGVAQFTSDKRVKENITSYSKGLEIIEAIDVKSFNYTYSKDNKIIGVIAQDIEQILPEAVTQTSFETPKGEKFDDFRMVDQNKLFYTLINAVKELSAKNKELEARLDAAGK